MTGDQIGVAIEQARTSMSEAEAEAGGAETEELVLAWAVARCAHLDTLAAIHQLHWPQTLTHTNQTICGGCASVHQPCPDERVVIDALTRMGALEATDADQG